MYRQVIKTQKSKQGILAMSGTWGMVSKEDAIKHINTFEYKYYVFANGSDMDVHVIYTPYGYLLQTTPDINSGHNLNNLPDI